MASDGCRRALDRTMAGTVSLNALPEDIVEHVMSFVPFEERCGTS